MDEKQKSYRVVLEGRDVGLYGPLHVAGGHKGGCQVDVAVDEVGLQPDGVLVVLEGLLQLAALLVHVAQVGVGLRQERVLLDGQSAEVRRPKQRSEFLTKLASSRAQLGHLLVVLPALEVDGGEEK